MESIVSYKVVEVIAMCKKLFCQNVAKLQFKEEKLQLVNKSFMGQTATVNNGSFFSLLSHMFHAFSLFLIRKSLTAFIFFFHKCVTS